MVYGMLLQKYVIIEMSPKLSSPSLRNKSSFSFTEIDKENPKKAFSFTLGTNEFDEYQVSDCDLDECILDKLLDDLNKSDNLSFFVLQMRKFSWFVVKSMLQD